VLVLKPTFPGACWKGQAEYVHPINPLTPPPPPELYFFALRSYVAAVVMRRFSHPKSQNPGHFFFLFFFPSPPLEKCIHATSVAIHVLFLMSDAWKEKERD